MPLSGAAMEAVFRATNTTPAGAPINGRWMLADAGEKQNHQCQRPRDLTFRAIKC
jgi:hypothetical protein